MQLVEQHVIGKHDPRYAAIDAAAFAKVAQWVLKALVNNWKAFFEARVSYRCDPSKFLGRPQLPKYKHKSDGRNLLVYTIQALSKKALKCGLIQPSMLPIEVHTLHAEHIDQVRIVPHKGFYIVEVVYEQAMKQAPVNPA